jgi:hypothetical protein
MDYNFNWFALQYTSKTMPNFFQDFHHFGTDIVVYCCESYAQKKRYIVAPLFHLFDRNTYSRFFSVYGKTA